MKTYACFFPKSFTVALIIRSSVEFELLFVWMRSGLRFHSFACDVQESLFFLLKRRVFPVQLSHLLKNQLLRVTGRVYFLVLSSSLLVCVCIVTLVPESF